MAPAQPSGAPAPRDGRIPASSARGCENRDFSLYVHIPFCSVRCGYCDFNTYATEDFGDGIGLGTYADDAIAEILFAAHETSRAISGAYSAGRSGCFWNQNGR